MTQETEQKQVEKQVGIVEQMKAAKTKKEALHLWDKVLTYKYISKKTMRKVMRLARSKGVKITK